MGRLQRTQVLFEPEQHEALAEIAEEEGRSISGLVREIVRHHLAERSEQARRLNALKAIERLVEIRSELQEEHGIFAGDPLSEVRAEWGEDVERNWRGES